MTWFYYAILSAFFTANSVALSKKTLQDCDVYTVAWARYGYALPFNRVYVAILKGFLG